MRYRLLFGVGAVVTGAILVAGVAPVAAQPKDKVGPAIDASLKRLDCDYIDLLLIHWPSPRVPLPVPGRRLKPLSAKTLARRTTTPC